MYILIVEDDESVRKGLQAALVRKGHTVAYADNGEAAIRQMHKEAIDLVLLDMMLGEGRMSGWDVLLHRMEDPDLAHIPIIIVSGLSSSTIHERAERARTSVLEGIIITMGKPVDLDLLFKAIKEIEDRKKASSAP
jgi:CheY-like chemotaxis protein